MRRCLDRKIRVGDLVLPVDSREFLYSSPDKVEREEDPIDLFWDDSMPAIVSEVLNFDPTRDYYQVRVIVNEMIGWTYSDYIWVICRYSG